MSKKILSIFLAVVFIFSAGVVPGGEVAVTAVKAAAADADEGEWVGAWGTGMTNISIADYDEIKIAVKDCSVREIITPTVSGDKIRLKFSNKFGNKDLVINRAKVAYSASNNGPTIDRKSSVEVTFGGSNRNFVIPAGEERYSDPIPFKVTAYEDIAVSLYAASNAFQDITTVGLSGGTSYISSGNTTADEMPYSSIQDIFSCFKLGIKLDGISINAMPVLSCVDVLTTGADPYSVVVIGDSTVANDLPEYIARCIGAEGYSQIGVVGKGIIGNSLLSDGQGLIGNIYGPAVLNRMDDDVLGISGVKYAILKIGGNDIIHPESASIAEYGHYSQPTADELIEGYKEFIERCHDAGVKVVAMSITQWKGTTRNYFGNDEYHFTDADWQIALDVNDWMAKTDLLDGFVDVTEISADPQDYKSFRPNYSNDKIHPNDTLQQIWAKEFPLIYLGIRPAPTKIVISKSSLALSSGQTAKLSATVYPKNTVNSSVAWSSSDKSVATVSKDGVVTAVGNGKAKIYCSAVNGIKDYCSVNVSTLSTDVILNTKTLNMYKSQTKTLTATVLPDDTTDKSLSWKSSDTSVAKVSSSGKVTAVGTGTATITCKTKDTGAFMTCKVNVTKKVYVKSVSLDESEKAIFKNKTFQLTATVVPTNASDKAVTWKSTDTSVATVSSKGVVTGKKNGTATIIATTRDGKYSATCVIKVKTRATGVTLNKTKTSLYVGEKYTLKPTVKPSSASNKNVTWKSSDKSVATVSSKGVVTAKGTGTATITATTQSGSFKASCKVYVDEFVKVEKVVLSKSSKTLNVSDTYTLKATVVPADASNKSVTWKSSNSKVAKVSSKGVVTAVGKGTAKITVTTKDGKRKDVCTVKVKYTPVKSLKLSKSSLTLDAGTSKKLSYTISPSNASNKNVTWSSSNKKVAKVSSSGKVTAVSAGTATITCKTKDGGIKKTCKVTVKRVLDPNQPVLGIRMNQSAIRINAGMTYRLTASIIPANAGNQYVIWTSNNPDVATVNGKGIVTAKKAGTAVIYVTTLDGGWKSSCSVNVIK